MRVNNRIRSKLVIVEDREMGVAAKSKRSWGKMGKIETGGVGLGFLVSMVEVYEHIRGGEYGGFRLGMHHQLRKREWAVTPQK
jgi:hypothetical protein